MSFIVYDENYKIETVYAARLNELGDRLYYYRIISKEPESAVKEFCMSKLRKCYYRNNKPNPFSPELIEFKNTTNLGDISIGDMYEFKIKIPSTT